MSEGGMSGGFAQSPNPFGGLNNTDLRPRRRRRRPVPLLNTSWVRKQESAMHKDVGPLIDTLRASVNEIASSGADNREELITRSFGEFQEVLGKSLSDYYGAEPEPLAKGLNHISAFASALNRMNQTITAIKTGRPSYMVDSDSSTPPEILPPEMAIELDHFMAVGVFALRSMVNDSVELPETEEEITRAEKAGELVKIEADGGDILLKTLLPDSFRAYITHPLDLMVDAADLSREMLAVATERAEELLKADAVPQDIIEAYPDLFEVEGLDKAFPPAAKKKVPATDGTDAATGDEAEGDGAADQGAGLETGDVTDDTPQDPLEILARLATIMVVITGSLLQGQTGDPTAANPDAASPTMPPGTPTGQGTVGLQRGTPIETTPLAKILGGEVEVDPTVYDAFIELEDLRKKAPTLEKKVGDQSAEIALLKSKVEELSRQPAAPRGVVARTVLGKGEEETGRGNAIDALTERLEKMRKDNPQSEGGEAAKLLIGAVHSGGGRPFAPIAPIGG